jgi:hypothetical protein
MVDIPKRTNAAAVGDGSVKNPSLDELDPATDPSMPVACDE